MTLWLACCSSLCLKPTPWLTEKARRDLGWMPTVCHQRTIGGFTLAELLISLAILGVIATFTIPKILSTQQNQHYNACGKEAISAISGAYQVLQSQVGVSATTKPSDLMPYINYIRTESAGVLIDHLQTLGSQTCQASGFICYRLANGGILVPYDNAYFGGTATTNAMLFFFDPDGAYAGTTNGPGKSIEIELYYDGGITTRGTARPGTTSADASRSADPIYDPPWFSW